MLGSAHGKDAIKQGIVWQAAIVQAVALDMSKAESNMLSCIAWHCSVQCGAPQSQQKQGDESPA